ncbi:AraC family transcription regulator protein [Herbaspirillum rubrisubalbicans M1]|uniref:AraC family transcriptional regulator n=1 Tax=Herbaspirillum rubrisubalbicans TaxID=80842 RepID=UPI00073A05D4|nr:AraC family transcriptional regulator [Herbaspirillum rubrisubalbicans]ALU90058.1 AraC family transcription regulator protein [Herbaspirillum rubrisubalbicans M1]
MLKKASDTPSIPFAFVEDALGCLLRQGYETAPVLQQAGLVSNEDELGPVTAEQYGALWLAIARITDDEFFGLSARPMRQGSFTLLCHAVLHSQSLGQALRRALRFLRIVLDEPYGELHVEDGKAHIILIKNRSPYPAFAYRTFLLLLLGLACWLVGRRIPLQRIDFSCALPEGRPDYLEFFGVPVNFNKPRCCLSFDAVYLDLPVIRSDIALKPFLRDVPANLLVRYRHDTGWVTRLRDSLKQSSPTDWPDFDVIAERFEVSPATLRRRLRDEGQSYASLKDEIRSGLAQALLGKNELSVAQISTQLGFTEPSAFHRAFRKWTGKSPGAFRRDLLKIRVGDRVGA